MTDEQKPATFPGTHLPRVLWLGMVTGQWPILAFGSEGQTLGWFRAAAVAGDEVRQKRLWRVSLGTATELELVVEREYLREVER